MEIDKVNSVNNIYKTEQTSKTKKTNSKLSSNDNVSLSNEAKKASEISSYIEMVNSSPDVREDRIAEIKEKLANNAYSSEQITEQLADRIAQSLGINLS